MDPAAIVASGPEGKCLVGIIVTSEELGTTTAYRGNRAVFWNLAADVDSSGWVATQWLAITTCLPVPDYFSDDRFANSPVVPTHLEPHQDSRPEHYAQDPVRLPEPDPRS